MASWQKFLPATQQSRPTLASSIAWAAASALLFLAAWEALGRLIIWWRDAPFPLPLETARRFAELLGGALLMEHPLWRHTADSLVRWWAGFAAGAIFGVIIAGMVIVWSWAERLLMPFVYFVQLVPCVAWIPLALLIFGVSGWAAVFMSAVAAFTPITINLVSAMKASPPVLVRVGAMCGLRGWRLFRQVMLPAAVPHLVSGLRVGVANAWRLVVAGEMIVGTGTGLGYSILQARWTLDYAAAFVCVAIIAAIGLAAERLLFTPLERATLRRWGMAW